MNARRGPAGKRAGGTHLENPTRNAVGRGRAVFISYAHADNSSPDPAARWLDRLLLNLKALAFEELIRSRPTATSASVTTGTPRSRRI